MVGIARYQSIPDKLQLQFAERDAEAIYSILISPEGGNFRAENVHKLTGAKATLAGLRRELETWLPSVAKDEDRVLIYFAGHGFVYQGKAYLAPYDIDLGNIARTGYGMDALGAAIGGKIRAQIEDRAHRRVPLGRHHAGGYAAHQPLADGLAEVGVLADREPRPRAIV